MGVIIVVAAIGLLWLAPIWAGQRVGERRGRIGWAWGLCFGWLGVVAIAVFPPVTPGAASEGPDQSD